jgi:hypothetical protein
MKRTLSGLFLLATLAAAYACDTPSGLQTADATAPQPATCSNGLKDGAEGDIDCGGACDKKCVDAQACRAPADCATGSCGVPAAPVNAPEPGLETPISRDAGKTDCALAACQCLPATGKDGAKNADETDVDCGGTHAPKCGFARTCASNVDCASADCKNGVCAASSGDGTRNGTETDIDCGGAGAAACAAGRRCTAASDCRSASCVGKICQPPTHNDGALNLDETDVDCGGADPIARCAVGKGCTARTDCAAKSCDLATKKCRQPAINGFQDGDETDVDCGGPAAPPCAVAKTCAAGDDCESSVCTTLRCAAPTATDGKKNGDESDVDCGGISTSAPRCPIGNKCVVHGDCKTDGCDYNKKCAITRSCEAHYGGDTCGSGEVGELAAKHESCCTQLAITRPGATPVRLGKYNVTAGRLRAFFERTGGDIRAAVSSNSKWTASYGAYTNYLPTTMEGALAQVGPGAQDFEWPQPSDTLYFPDRSVWAARGCQNSVGGARTYWQPPGVDKSNYPQDVLDQKTANCMTKIMLAAFCIWDGGDLPLGADLTWAWRGPQGFRWPWGNAPEPPGVDFAGSDYVVHRYNYAYPNFVAPDAAYNVPAPGRRPAGYGPFGHADLAGTLFEFARDALFLNSGSWERHTPSANGSLTGTANQQWNRRYYAIGGRCVY